MMLFRQNESVNIYNSSYIVKQKEAMSYTACKRCVVNDFCNKYNVACLECAYSYLDYDTKE